MGLCDGVAGSGWKAAAGPDRPPYQGREKFDIIRGIMGGESEAHLPRPGRRTGTTQ